MILGSINARLGRAWLWIGCPVLLGVFCWFLSRGGWRGTLDTYAYNYVNIGGLVPHSDAAAYFADTLEMAFAGHWGAMGSRRPVAAALRQTLALMGDYSYVRTLLIQAGILSVLLWFCTYRVVIWRGAAAGLVFVTLMVVLVAPFAGTFMTEPIGIMWALASIICFVEAVRRRSLAFGLLALTLLTFGMLTRPGGLFLLPAFALWLVFIFARNLKDRLRLMALAALCILTPVAVNAGLAQLYAGATMGTAGDFVFAVCDLTLGRPASNDCFIRYANELRAAGSTEKVAISLAHAKEHFAADPRALFHSLSYNAHRFVAEAPDFFVNGYTGFPLVNWLEARLLAIPFALLILLYLWRADWTECSFWAAALVSVYASAAIIMIYDGWRALYVSHPYLILLIACSASVIFEPVPLKSRDLNARIWGTAVASVAALMLVVPGVSYLIFGAEREARSQLSRDSATEIVLSAHRLTGFLIVPDGSERRISAIPRSKFDHIIKSNGLEGEADFGSFLNRLPAGTSFAFVSGVVLNRTWFSMRTYIAPSEALQAEGAMMTFVMDEPPGGSEQIRVVRTMAPTSATPRSAL